MQDIAEKVLPGDLPAAIQLSEAVDTYNQKGLWDLSKACKEELDNMIARKRENDQINRLVEASKQRGITHINIDIEAVNFIV